MGRESQGHTGKGMTAAEMGRRGMASRWGGRPKSALVRVTAEAKAAFYAECRERGVRRDDRVAVASRRLAGEG